MHQAIIGLGGSLEALQLELLTTGIALTFVQPHPEGSKPRQAYCLRLPDNIALFGEGIVCFKGNYVYGNASHEELVCIVGHNEDIVTNISVTNITFEFYFFGVGVFKAATVVLSNFVNMRFVNCAIGLYARGLERCSFVGTTAHATGAVIVVGGQWATKDDIYSEAGGFGDKVDFGTIHNIYGRVFGRNEENIDRYFDKFFFKTENNFSIRKIRVEISR